MRGLSVMLALAALGTSCFASVPVELDLTSPGGMHHVKFYGKKSDSGANVLCYRVDFNGKQVWKSRRPACSWTIGCGRWLWE